MARPALATNLHIAFFLYPTSIRGPEVFSNEHFSLKGYRHQRAAWRRSLILPWWLCEVIVDKWDVRVSARLGEGVAEQTCSCVSTDGNFWSRRKCGCVRGGGKVSGVGGVAFLKNPSRLRTGSRRQTAAASPHEALNLATLIRAAAPTYEKT